MSVAVEGHGDGRMTEVSLDGFRVGPVSDQQRCIRVAKVVRPLRASSAFEGSGPKLGDVSTEATPNGQGYLMAVLGAIVGSVTLGIGAGVLFMLPQMSATDRAAGPFFLGILLGGTAGAALGCWLLLSTRGYQAARLTAGLLGLTFPVLFIFVLFAFNIVTATPLFALGLISLPVTAPLAARAIALTRTKESHTSTDVRPQL